VVFLKNRTQSLWVGNVTILEWPPFHGPPVSAGHIVVSDRYKTLGGQCLAGMAADISRTSRNKNIHQCLVIDILIVDYEVSL
jgi:hypothetical protein